MENELKIEKPEIKEKEPKISYHILYGAHRTAEDFKKLKEALEKADVYVPEMVGWNLGGALIFNSLSMGAITPEQMAEIYQIKQDSPYFKICETIYNSKKPILFADISRNHELLQERRLNIGSFNLALSLFRRGEFPLALKVIRGSSEKLSNYFEGREKIIKQTLKNSVRQLSEEHPQLKDKKDIKVLLTLGIGHTQVYHSLKKKEESVSREFTETPFIFNFLGEIDRRHRLSKNKEISNELLAKFILDDLMIPELGEITQNSNKMIKVSRKIISKLNLKDIERISKELGENPEKTITDVLEARGVKVPKTEEEMDEMLEPKKRK